MTTTLITGASGFIAQHVAGILRRTPGQRVVGLDIRSVPRAAFDETHTVDLTDFVATRRAVAAASPRVVYHLVGLIRGSDESIHASNVDTARNLLEALRDIAPHARVVLVGSAAEYGVVPIDAQPVRETFVGQPTGAYGRAKRELTALAERAAREFAQHVSVARPFNVIGPGVPDSLVVGAIVHRLRAAMAGPPPRSIKLGRTTAVRDFIAVEDVANGLVKVAERGRAGESYNLCSGEGHSIAELLELLITLAAEPIAVERDLALIRPGDVDAMVGSFDKAARELEWRPSISVQDSLRASWTASVWAGR